MMNVDEISAKVTDLELEIEEFKSQHDMDEMRKKRNEYNKVRRSKQDNISVSEMTILNKDNSVCDCYNKRKKNLRDLQHFLNDIIQQQSQGCQNCKRNTPTGEDSGMVPYELQFKLHPQNSLIKRQSFRFVGINNSSEDIVVLCMECSDFLTNPDNKVAKSFDNVCPSFVWNLLSDKKILDVYGVFVWRFLPEKWRYWWIDAVHGCDIFEGLEFKKYVMEPNWREPVYSTSILFDLVLSNKKLRLKIYFRGKNIMLSKNDNDLS